MDAEATIENVKNMLNTPRTWKVTLLKVSPEYSLYTIRDRRRTVAGGLRCYNKLVAVSTSVHENTCGILVNYTLSDMAGLMFYELRLFPLAAHSA